MTDTLTPEERALIDQIGDCYLAFDRLDQYHPADREEFAFHIHALGRIAMARAAIRAYPARLQRPGGGRDWTPTNQSPA